jgi:nucleoside transporter
LHLIGAGLLFWMAKIRDARKFWFAALLYALSYAPTISLANGIMFTSIPDSVRDAPTLRVWGTIGWIASNLFLKVLLQPGQPVNNRPLLLASVLAAVFGLFAFVLPNTPPTNTASAFPFFDALALLKDPPFAVFFGVSFLITIALAFYYSFTSLFLEQRVGVRSDNVGPLMTIGQWAEIIFMLLLPWFLQNFGMKWVLVMGMGAWGVRYALFTLGKPFPLILIGLALHGICYDFFFQAGFIHVDGTAPADIKQSAQALFVALSYGIGMYLGTEASGWTNHYFTKETPDPVTGELVKVTDWSKFWLAPCVGVLICLVLFVILFN